MTTEIRTVPDVIDGEFEVIGTVPDEPKAWSFWVDGFPGLIVAAGSPVLAGLLGWLLRHH